MSPRAVVSTAVVTESSCLETNMSKLIWPRRFFATTGLVIIAVIFPWPPVVFFPVENTYIIIILMKNNFGSELDA